MTNSIIDEVREARAALAAEHDYDSTRIIAWARAQTAVRKAALSKPKANKSQEKTGGTRKSPVTRKHCVRV